jgi:glycosyltransferase 2 family protein
VPNREEVVALTSRATVTPPADTGLVVVEEPALARYVRRPVDGLRLLLGLAVVLVGIAVAVVLHDTLLGFERDVLNLFRHLPAVVTGLVVGVAQVVALLVPVLVTVAVLVRRELRQLGLVLLGSVLAALSITGLGLLIQAEGPKTLIESVPRPGVVQAGFPDRPYLAAAAAAATIMLVDLAPRWQRAGTSVLLLLTLSRLIAGKDTLLALFITLATGWTVGAAILYLLGTPNRRPDGGALAAALEQAGLPVQRLRRLDLPFPGSRAYGGNAVSGEALFVRVRDRDDHTAGLFGRLYRYLRLRHGGDIRPLASLRDVTEREALGSYAVSGSGARTPALLAVTEVGEDAMVLAYRWVDGRRWDEIDPAELDDQRITDFWIQVARLHSRRVAHGNLRQSNLMVDAAAKVWLVGTEVGELSADRRRLSQEVAQALCSVALAAGADRAVTTATAGLGRSAVVAALPMLQPLALSRGTRSALKQHPELLADLRSRVQTLAGLDTIRYEQLERVRPRTILTLVAATAAGYVLLTQVTNVDLGSVVTGADWTWASGVLVFAAMTYPGAALNLVGFMPERLPFRGLLVVQLAASFVTLLAPSVLGGAALNGRFAQKKGIEPAAAVAAVGIANVASALMHLTLLAVFLAWAGSTETAKVRLPKGAVLLVVAGVVLFAALVLLVVPAGRRLVAARLVPAVRRMLSGVRESLRPANLVIGFGGAGLLTLSNLAALALSVQAFGGGLSFRDVGVVYLAGSILASAAPTPGGLGAVEAALAAGLTAAGLPSQQAVSAVLLFRLATFWLPVLPGWVAFHRLQRTGEI